MIQEGIVSWFDDKKGYGSIETKALKNIFVHYTSIQDDLKGLKEHQKVEFKLITPAGRGPQAINVRKI